MSKPAMAMAKHTSTDIRAGNSSEVICLAPHNPERWDENAAHIVKCVNMHDKLVAALEKSESTILSQHEGDISMIDTEVLAIIREALKMEEAK